MAESLRAQVVDAVRLVSEHLGADDDELIVLLTQRGWDRGRAQRLVQFIPIAFGRVHFKASGVVFQQSFILQNCQTGRRITRSFLKEPLFQDVLAVASSRELGDQEVLALASQSAEVDAIRQLTEQGSKTEDIILSEPAFLTDEDL